jgi:Flp pilus assembly protein TadG
MDKKRHGHSALEFAFFLPYLLFLFVGAFDWGFYSWALMSTENAARTAALYTSSSSTNAADSAGACNIATAELADAPNVAASPAVAKTAGSGSATCTGNPITVTATSVTSGADGAAASQVSVTYKTPQLIPIPGSLTGQLSITRTVEMKVR